MKRRFISFALALAVLCQAAAALAAFGPFSTINHGGASTLKGLGTTPDPLLPNEKWRQGAVITPVSNLAANTEVFVTSVRDWFRWDPSSTAPADDLTIVSLTANGANPGRFLRLFRGDPYWKAQTTWYVDIAGNDENDGSVLSPVKTDIEIQRRWGAIGARARLAIPVTVIYAQSPAQQTNYLVDFAEGGSLTLVGTPTVTKAGITISAVTAQVRTTGSTAAWAIGGSGIGATEVGKIGVITDGTAGNIGAYCFVLKDNGGGVLRVSPFGKFSASSVPFTQVTPIVGDTIEFRDVSATTLQIGTIETHSLSNTAIATPQNYVVFDSLKLVGNASSGNGTIYNDRAFVFYARSVLEALSMAGTSGSTATHRICGGGVTGAFGVVVRGGASISTNQVGFLSSLTLKPGAEATLFADTYFQNSNLSVGRGAFVNTQGVAFFDRSSSNSAMTVSPGGFCQQTGSVPDWGTGNTGHGVVVQSAASYAYALKPTVNEGLGAGREAQIGGTDKLYSAVPFIEPANNAALVLTQ